MAARSSGGRSRQSAPRAIAMPDDERESVSVRKIKNGYLIDRSGTRKGKYYCEQEFSAEKPQLLAAPAQKGAAKPARGRGRR